MTPQNLSSISPVTQTRQDGSGLIDCSIIVVTYNGRDMNISCLTSLEKGMGDRNYEIIVVDNGSWDGTPSAIQSLFPQATVIKNQVNRGYAAAANQGLRIANGRYLLLLNNDTIVPVGGLQILIDFLEMNGTVGIVGPQLTYPDGRTQLSFDSEPSLLTELFIKNVQHRLVLLSAPTKVPNLVGACLMIRRSVLNEIGMLDEQFFYLYEETDLSLRARKAGWGIVVHPDVRVIHLQGQTRKQAKVRARIEHARSLFSYFRKNHRLQYYALLLMYPFKSLLETGVWSVLTICSLGLWSEARNKAQEVSGVLAWQVLLQPHAMGLIGGQKHGTAPIQSPSQNEVR